MTEITVIIPVYNEKNVVLDTIASVEEGLKAIDHEIIVVNDGSTDSDYEFVLAKGCRLLKNKKNSGYGASLKKGIIAANSEWIGIIDADGTYNGKEFKNLWEIKNRSQADMIVGARSGWKSKIPLIRRPAKFILNQLANYLSESKIPDLNSGLRIFKKDLAMKYLHLFPNGFSLTTTITLSALCNNHDVEFTEIEYHRRKGKSKIRPIHDTKEFFLTVIRTILYFNPLKVCVPLSFIFGFISIFVLLFSHFKLHRIMDGTVSVFAMMSIQAFVLGLLADLFVRRSEK